MSITNYLKRTSSAAVNTYAPGCYAACALLLSAAILSGCGSSHDKAVIPVARAAESPTIEVTIAEAVTRAVPAYIQTTGTFVADLQSNVAPETSGQVVATYVEAGAFVARGDVIARLDDRDARLRLQQAEVEGERAAEAVRQAEAQLGVGEGRKFEAADVAEARGAQAQLASAEAAARLAEATRARFARLVESGDTSRLSYEQYRTQAETAQAQAAAARQQLQITLNVARGADRGVAVARKAIEAARTQTALAQKAVDDAIIRAPFAGYVLERRVAPGEYVTPASAVLVLVRINPLKLQLQMPEAEAGRVRIGLSVSAEVAAHADQRFSGRVTAISPALDATARVLTTEAIFDNPQNLLRPGMFATARLLLPGGEQGVYVPRAAVINDSTTNSQSVYIIEGNIARLRVVQVGDLEGDEVRVLSGIAPGESIATSNLENLFDGANVRR